MAYDPRIHHRRSIRLRQFDYAQPGAYFITIVTGDRSSVFGVVEGSTVRLNAVGQMIDREWRRLSSRFPNVKLDAFVVMPNHIHGILIIEDARTGTATNAHDLAPDEPRRALTRDGGTADNATDHSLGVSRRAPTPSLPPTHATFGAPMPGSVATIVRAFKSSTTLRVHRMKEGSVGNLWHRNYYEHVIRDQADLNRIRKYIEDNLGRWAEDRMKDNETPASHQTQP